MIDDEILQALQQSTTAAVLASIMPALPVKYIDITFEVPNDQKYLECVFIPNNREDYWGNEMNYTGMFRLILHWQNNNQGAYPPIQLLRSIAGYFTKGKLLQNVQISANPTFNGVLEEGTETLYPLSLRYQRFS